MDFLGFTMEALLAILLMATLAYGMRLERRLKALRDTQAGFAQAVLTLDAAAARADEGLKNLKAATDEAQDVLHDRILKARELKGELERLIARAETAKEKSMSLAPAAPAATRPVEEALVLTVKADERPLSFRPTDRERRPVARNLDEDLFETVAEFAPRQRAFGVR